jgi:AraC family transcriptional activator of pobA
MTQNNLVFEGFMMTISEMSEGSPPLRARSLQVMQREGRWRLESLRSRTEHTYLWVTRGQGRINIGTQTRGIGPNTIIHIPAGLPHAIRLAPTAQGHCVHASQNLAMPVPAGPVMIRAANVFEQGQITGFFENVLTEVNAGQAGLEQAAESYLTLLAVWIERHIRYNDWLPPPQTRTERIVAGFLDAVELGGPKLRPVGEIAAALGITPTHLTRLCRETLGRGALDIVHDRVILEACLLLKDGTDSAAEISRRLGFASPAHFNRLFRARLGLTPLTFRQEREAGNDATAKRRPFQRS